MATMILRPKDDNLISEEECDGDATYLSTTSDDRKGITVKKFFTITNPPDFRFYAFDDIRVYTVARKTSGKGSVQVCIRSYGGGLTVEASTGEIHDITTSYVTYVDHMTDVAHELYGNIHGIKTGFDYLDITLISDKENIKDEKSETRLTQVWIEIDYSQLYSINVVSNDSSCTFCKVEPTLALYDQECEFSAYFEKGCRVGGWYSDKECKNLLSKVDVFNYKIKGDTTLYLQGAYETSLKIKQFGSEIISNIDGYDSHEVVFYATRDIYEWRVRAVLDGNWVLIAQGDRVSSYKSITVEITDEQLKFGDGVYRVYIEVRDIDGYWSDGTYEEIPE